MRVPSLETRVVRLISADGFSRYISVSTTWQWLRLAWTFRNFSQLPETVLSPGQRHLLTTLCSRGTNEPRLDRWNVIGTFELRANTCEQLFGSNPQRTAANTEIEPVKRPQAAVVRRESELAESIPVAKLPDLPYAEFRKRSGHRTAAAICVLLLVGSTYAWQRLAQAGYVRPPVAVNRLGDLTQPAVAAAQVSMPEPVQVAAQSGPATEAPAAQTVEPLAPQPEAQQVPAAPVAAPTAPPAPATEPHALPAPTANPTKVAELRAPATPAREAAPVEKPVEKTSDPSAIESLRQDARPKSLIYPSAGSRTGKVVLGVTVGADGAVENVQVVSGDRALARSAAATVKNWHYGATGGEEFKSVVTVMFMGDDAVMVRFPTQAELGR